MKKMSFDQMEALAEHDLEWLFNNAESDCGIKSNWNSMVNAAFFGGSSYIDHTNLHQLNSISYARDISKVYYSLSDNSQKILYATFGNINIEPLILRYYKKYSGAALSNIESQELYLLLKKTNKKQTTADKYILSQIRINSIKSYNESITSYVFWKNEAKYV